MKGDVFILILIIHCIYTQLCTVYMDTGMYTNADFWTFN